MKAEFGESDPVTELYLKCYEEITSMTHVRYTTTWELVREAGCCHKGGCYVAASVICRGALEAALHEAFSWKMKDGQLFLDPRLKYCTPNLERLIEWAKDASLLTDDQAKIAHKIQHEGNFGAHLKQKIDREFFEGKAPDKPYRLWMDPQESWGLFNETVELVIALVKKALEIESRKE